MAGTIVGNAARAWSGKRNDVGHREYTVKYRVRMDSTLDGPATVYSTPGMYLPGAPYVLDNDVDLWAWCRQEMDIEPEAPEGEPNEYFDVTQHFSTAPLKRCGDFQVDDPLLEPMRVSGTFVRFVEEAHTDRFGNPIVNSAHEQIRGPQVEFDRNRPSLRVEQNVPLLQLELLSQFVDAVNDDYLWGLPPRCVKLSNVSWEQLYHGQCNVYYKRVLEFDVNFETFDRVVPDEATKVLSGKWGTVPSTGTGSGGTTGWVLVDVDGVTPDPTNPQHFVRMTDRNGNLISGQLNGAGLPAGVNYAVAVDYYISVSSANIGNPLTSTAYWIKVTGASAESRQGLYPAAWQQDSDYSRGNLVSYKTTGGDRYFVALSDNSGVSPFSTATWQELLRSTGTPGSYAPKYPTSRGIYDSATSYEIGDYVRTQVTGVTDFGTVKVEKYPEANLLLLGIPLVF